LSGAHQQLNMLFKIALISALAPNRSIGHADSLPWKLPRDLRFFKRMTAGHAVLMGRKTFESLGCRPLPKRVNIVLSTKASYPDKRILVARNLDEAIDLARAHSLRERLFVIGGGSIYDQYMSMADELYLTQIQPRDPKQKFLFDEEFYGDTFFPRVRGSAWELCHMSRLYRALDTTTPRPDPDPEKVNYYFRFFKYGKKSSCGCTLAEKRQVSEALKTQSSISFPVLTDATRHVER
jgi:dihydrofolate reductase